MKRKSKRVRRLAKPGKIDNGESKRASRERQSDAVHDGSTAQDIDDVASTSDGSPNSSQEVLETVSRDPASEAVKKRKQKKRKKSKGQKLEDERAEEMK